jgi:hypothetical protein
MRLNCGEGNGFSLARKTSHSIVRIDRTALIALIYSILCGRCRSQLPTEGGSRSTVTSNTDRGSKACESDVLQVFFCLWAVAIGAGYIL